MNLPEGSFVAPLVDSSLSYPMPFRCEIAIDRLVVIRDSGCEVHEPPEQSWDGTQAFIRDAVDPVYYATYQRLRRVEGFWAPVWQITQDAVHIEALRQGEAEDESDAARRAFVNYLETRVEALPPLLGAHNNISRTIHWGGVVWNGATLIVVSLLIWSYAGTPAYLRDLRAARAARLGICAKCKYSLKDLAPVEGVVTCPECGRKNVGRGPVPMNPAGIDA